MLIMEEMEMSALLKKSRVIEFVQSDREEEVKPESK